MASPEQSAGPLKLGFIGGGINSAIGSAHFAASMLDNRFTVTSGCFSRDKKINEQTALRWHIDSKSCFTDWRAYLSYTKPAIDALCILTPIPDHYEMLVAALDLEIPVICEKALVCNTIEASKLQARYASQPHFLAVTLNYSGYPVVRLLRHMIAQGHLGTVQQIHLEMPLENYLRIPIGSTRPAKPQRWRQSDGDIPTLLLDLGVHLHHLLYYLTDASAQQVMAQFNHFSTQPQIIDDARIWVECDKGIQANMWMSKTALGHRNGMRIRVFGDQGSAEWYQFNPEILQMTDVHGVRSQLDRGVENDILGTQHYNRFKAGHPTGYIESFGNLYWDIADALSRYRENGTACHPEVFGMDHSYDGLALLEAAVKAHANRSWVNVATTAAQTASSFVSHSPLDNVEAA